VKASVEGANGGFSDDFVRSVEQGFAEERSAFAAALVLLGVWKSAKAVELRLSRKATPVPNVGIGPGGKGALQRLTGTAELGGISLPVDLTLSEGEVVSLTGHEVETVQAKALGKKLGALLADELGVGRTAIAVVQ